MSTDETSAKNILLLIADDLGREFLGCYGGPSPIVTPNLDRLASESTIFDAAFASTASCSGSRSTIFTGLHTHENGQYGLHWTSTHFQTFPHIATAPELFNKAGYLTGIINKIHVGPEDVYPWTIREQSGTRDVAWVAERCGAFFSAAEEQDKPFFLTFGYVDPHRDIHSRGGFGNDDHAWKHLGQDDSAAIEAAGITVPPWMTDLPETRAELIEYYKAIRRLDHGIGLVYKILEERGLLESTLVVFTSDNGPPFLNSKTTLYDAGIHLPLLIRHPASPTAVLNPNMVSFIDLLPTFLDYAQIPSTIAESSSPSPTRLGRSLIPIIHETSLLSDPLWTQQIFGSHTFHEITNYWPTRILRTKRYKYHRNIAWRLDFPFASDLYASLSFEGIRNMSSPSPDRTVSETSVDTTAADAGTRSVGTEQVRIGTRTLRDYILRPKEELYDLANDPLEVVNLASEVDDGVRGIDEQGRDRDRDHQVVPESATEKQQQQQQQEERKQSIVEVLTWCRDKVSEWQRETKDPWLFRDGVSLTTLSRYVKDGLQVPDRLDFATANPGTKMEGLQMTKLLGNELSFQGMSRGA